MSPLKSQTTDPTLNKAQCDANRFKLQANAQAEAKTIKEWVNKQGKKGTHADVTFVDIPVDASDDEFEEIMDPDALMEEID